MDYWEKFVFCLFWKEIRNSILSGEYLGLYPYLSFNGQSNDPVIRNPLKNSPKQFWDLSSTLSGMLYSIDLRNWLNSGDVA